MLLLSYLPKHTYFFFCVNFTMYIIKQIFRLQSKVNKLFYNYLLASSIN